MSEVFKVTASIDDAPLSAQRRGQVAFTAQNTSGRSLRGRAKVVAEDPAEQGWYSVRGEAWLEFRPDQVQQIMVDIAIPDYAPPGRTGFQLELVSVERPDADAGRSGPVSVDIPPIATAPPPTPAPSAAEPATPVTSAVQPPPAKKSPWAIIGGVVAALVIALGALWFFVLRGPGEVEIPDLAGLDLQEATGQLAALELAWDTTAQWNFEGTSQPVVDQDPAAGELVAVGGTVHLTVQTAPSDGEVLAEAERVVVEWLDALIVGDVGRALALSSVPFLAEGEAIRSQGELERFFGDIVAEADLQEASFSVDEVFLISDFRERLTDELGDVPSDFREQLREMSLDEDDVIVVVSAEGDDAGLFLRRVSDGLRLAGAEG